MKYFLITLVVVVSFFSCVRFGFDENKNVNIKYREKNPIEVIKIDSMYGDIEISGWARDFIEINTNKILNSGFSQDIDLMDTLFNLNGNELQVKTKIPARVEGKINLKIYIPFILEKLYINSEKGDIYINKFIGDAEITNYKGNINYLFQGSILRVNSYKTDINLYVRSYNSSDIVINNEEGTTNVNIETVAKHSFLDIKSSNGDINLFTAFDIDHTLTVFNKNDKINLRYDIFDKILIEKEYAILNGKRGEGDNLTIDLFNENAKINLDLANEKYLKKITNDMFFY